MTISSSVKYEFQAENVATAFFSPSKEKTILDWSVELTTLGVSGCPQELGSFKILNVCPRFPEMIEIPASVASLAR